MTEFVRGVDWLRSKVKGPGDLPEKKRKWQVSFVSLSGFAPDSQLKLKFSGLDAAREVKF